MSPEIHRKACEMVRLRQAKSYSEACAMLARRRKKKNNNPQPLRLPYKED